jgi:hypothetical protein
MEAFNDEAKEFFVKEGFQTAKIAEIESKKGTADPTYLYYTLGKIADTEAAGRLQEKSGRSIRAREIP